MCWVNLALPKCFGSFSSGIIFRACFTETREWLSWFSLKNIKASWSACYFPLSLSFLLHMAPLIDPLSLSLQYSWSNCWQLPGTAVLMLTWISMRGPPGRLRDAGKIKPLVKYCTKFTWVLPTCYHGCKSLKWVQFANIVNVHCRWFRTQVLSTLQLRWFKMNWWC